MSERKFGMEIKDIVVGTIKKLTSSDAARKQAATVALIAASVGATNLVAGAEEINNQLNTATNGSHTTLNIPRGVGDGRLWKDPVIGNPLPRSEALHNDPSRPDNETPKAPSNFVSNIPVEMQGPNGEAIDTSETVSDIFATDPVLLGKIQDEMKNTLTNMGFPMNSNDWRLVTVQDENGNSKLPSYYNIAFIQTAESLTDGHKVTEKNTIIMILINQDGSIKGTAGLEVGSIANTLTKTVPEEKPNAKNTKMLLSTNGESLIFNLNGTNTLAIDISKSLGDAINANDFSKYSVYGKGYMESSDVIINTDGAIPVAMSTPTPDGSGRMFSKVIPNKSRGRYEATKPAPAVELTSIPDDPKTVNITINPSQIVDTTAIGYINRIGVKNINASLTKFDKGNGWGTFDLPEGTFQYIAYFDLDSVTGAKTLKIVGAADTRLSKSPDLIRRLFALLILDFAAQQYDKNITKGADISPDNKPVRDDFSTYLKKLLKGKTIEQQSGYDMLINLN